MAATMSIWLLFLCFFLLNFPPKIDAQFSAEQQQIMEEISAFGEWIGDAYKNFEKILIKKEKQIEKWKSPHQIQYKSKLGEEEAENVEKLRAKFEFYIKNKNLYPKTEQIVGETAKYFDDLNSGHFVREGEFVVRQRLQAISSKFNEFRMEKWEKNFWKWQQKEKNLDYNRQNDEGTSFTFGAENLGEIEKMDGNEKSKGREEIVPANKLEETLGKKNKGKQQIQNLHEVTKDVQVHPFDEFEFEFDFIDEEKFENLAMEILTRIFRLNKRIWLQNYRKFVKQLLVKNEEMKEEIRQKFTNSSNQKFYQMENEIGEAIKEVRKSVILKKAFKKLIKSIESMAKSGRNGPAEEFSMDSRDYKELKSEIVEFFSGKREILDKKNLIYIEKNIMEWKMEKQKKFEKVQKENGLKKWAERGIEAIENEQPHSPVEKLLKFGKGLLEKIEGNIETKMKEGDVEKQEYRFDYFAVTLNIANIKLANLMGKEFGWVKGEEMEEASFNNLNKLYPIENEWEEMEQKNLIEIKILANQIIRAYLSELDRKIRKKALIEEGIRIFDAKSKKKLELQEIWVENEFVRQIRNLLNLPVAEEGEFRGFFELTKMSENRASKKAEEFVDSRKAPAPIKISVQLILDALKLLTIFGRLNKLLDIFGINRHFPGLSAGFMLNSKMNLEKGIEGKVPQAKKIGAFLYEKFVWKMEGGNNLNVVREMFKKETGKLKKEYFRELEEVKRRLRNPQIEEEEKKHLLVQRQELYNKLSEGESPIPTALNSGTNSPPGKSGSLKKLEKAPIGEISFRSSPDAQFPFADDNHNRHQNNAEASTSGTVFDEIKTNIGQTGSSPSSFGGDIGEWKEKHQIEGKELEISQQIQSHKEEKQSSTTTGDTMDYRHFINTLKENAQNKKDDSPRNIISAKNADDGFPFST